MRRAVPITTVVATSVLAPLALASPPIPKLPPPRDFRACIDNSWFPLRPGTVFLYRGEKDGHRGRDVVTVTRRHQRILGIQATVVRDRSYLRGRLAERTTDWYAQDRRGNVWYLGERTATLGPGGKVISTDGSWQAGVRGAKAGIYMPATPNRGDSGRQEYYRNHAEDQYRVLSQHAHVTSPAVSSAHALLTRETTRLEPGVVDHKLYVRGYGTVREVTVRGGSERWVLSSMKQGRCG